MDYRQIAQLNEFWTKQQEITILEPFVFSNGSFEGKIAIQSPPKVPLEFRVCVPLSYPFSNDPISIRFYCTNNQGIRHLNADNSVCMHVPLNTDFEKRLYQELELLRLWRDKYYINEQPDDRYDYPVFEFMDNNIFLFTDVDLPFKRGDFGTFQACLYADNTQKGMPDAKNHLILTIGSAKCQWAQRISELKANTEGLYYFLEEEPLRAPGKIVADWKDLDPLVSQNFKTYLNQLKTNKKIPDIFFILLGYRIPGTLEIHWEAVSVDADAIPVKARKVTPRYYEHDLISQQIDWSRAVNISYGRYFGRGQMHPGIADKKILIIGVGALGSSLAKILARSGSRHLSFCDMESLEPGNICRSEYNMVMVSQPKTQALIRELAVISPFLDVGIEPLISKILEPPHFEADKKRLQAYDLIFDCTSDMELAWVLDCLTLDKPVLNLSVTNEAKELVCVTGGHHIAAEKAQICNKLQMEEPELIYEGTGCWSPTFKASYFDINSLLNLAVKNIHVQSANGRDFHSFVIKTEALNDSISLKIYDY